MYSELYEKSGSDIIRELGKKYSDYRKRMGYTQKEVAVFEYDPLFLEQGIDIAPLTMSIY